MAVAVTGGAGALAWQRMIEPDAADGGAPPVVEKLADGSAAGPGASASRGASTPLAAAPPAAETSLAPDAGSAVETPAIATVEPPARRPAPRKPAPIGSAARAAAVA